jgi:two-component system sensor histidine kinase VicK
MEKNSTISTQIDNINFAYDVEQKRFSFIDSFLLETIEGQDLPHQLLGHIHADDIPVAERAYVNIMSGTFKGSVKFRLGKGNLERWLRITPFFDRVANVIYGCAIDISAEVDNLDSLTRYTNKKNSVLHMLAHDLRGPLDIARSLVVQMADQMEDEGSKRKSEAISSILQQSIALITNLTDREFIEMVGAALIKRRIDLVQKLKDYLEECRRSSDLANRTFVLEHTTDSAMVEVDEAKFMQVINNLMSNALKFTLSGGIITVRIEPHEDHVLLTCADNGIGIPAHMLPRIFDKFTSAARPGLNGEPTIGLGLSIVKDVIEWHQGKIWCESKEGVGSSFFIKLPVLDQNLTGHTE